jgi:monoamine oxidase
MTTTRTTLYHGRPQIDLASTPVGRLHWAGTQCAPQWNGYMEGAVRSGEAAADAVG